MKRLLLCLTFSLLSTVASAALVVDQEFVQHNGIGSFASPLSSVYGLNSQTFTVGVTGKLSAVDVFVCSINPPGVPLQVDIRSTVAGKPSGSGGVLTSAVVQHADVLKASDLPEVPGGYNVWNAPLLKVTLPPISVTAGDVLALTLGANSPGVTYYWIRPSVISINDPPVPDYAGGAMWLEDGGDFVPTLSDGTFRTYVDVVPEPSSALLLLASAIGFAGMRRR
jgi:hypothetical protein